MLESFRAVFMERLSTIMDSRSTVVCSIVAKALEQKSSPRQPASLWDSSMIDFELGRGAHKFRSEIVARSLGKDASLQHLTSSLSKWSHNLEDLRKTIKEMKSARWEEELDLDDDDELDAGRYQDLLSKEDPTVFAQRLDNTVETAFDDTLGLLNGAVTIAKDSDDGQRHIFLLRVTREISRQPNFPAAADNYHALVDKLHSKIAAYITGESLEYLRKQSDQARLIPFDRAPALTLWEGTPQLPAQPSAASIRLLLELRKSMQKAGLDLWTRSAVDVVKNGIQTKIAASITAVVLDVAEPAIATTAEEKVTPEITTTEEAQANGNGSHEEDESATTAEKINDDEAHNDKEESTTAAVPEESVSTDAAALAQKQIATQTLYDALYLQRLLTVSTTAKQNGNELQDVIGRLEEKAELESASVERLQKSSMDYYKKTYLLFAILSPP